MENLILIYNPHDNFFSMKIGIILNSNDPETIWNAFRLGNTSLLNGHQVKIFLLGKGVELSLILEKEAGYDIKGELDKFMDNGGEIVACGTCLYIRRMEKGICPIGTMEDLLKIISDSDKVISFG